MLQARLEILEADLQKEKLRRLSTEARMKAEIAALKKTPSIAGKAAMPSDCRGVYSNNPPTPPSGFYLVKSPLYNKRIDAVFCDFSESIGKPFFKETGRSTV